MSNQVIQPKVRDMSFLNIFARKLVVRLIAFLIVSIVVLFSAQSITENSCKQKIDNVLLRTSIELAQLADDDMSNDKKMIYANVLLSNAQEELESDLFITDTAMAFYNSTKGELVARSYEIPILLTEDALNWWREQSNIYNGFPTISMNAEMTEFCKANSELKLQINQMYYSNFVLFPVSISAIDKNGNIKDNFESTIPTVTQKIYEKQAEIKIVGNEENDVIYKMLIDFKFQQHDSDGDEKTDCLVLKYTNRDNYKNIDVETKTFKINNNEYQLDCPYQISFWSGMLLWVVIFELIGLLLCALSAFVNTKETFSMYY